MNVFLEGVICGTKIDADMHDNIELIIDNIIKSYKDELAIDSIAEVYFTEDLKSKVNELRVKNGSNRCLLIEKHGAMAYYFTASIGNILVYDNQILLGLLCEPDNKERKQASNLLLHELLHVHDENTRMKMKIFNAENYDQKYLDHALHVWAEYYAHRRSAEFFKVHDNELYYSILKEHTNNFKLAYDPYLLVVIARYIGNINSTDRIENVKDTFLYDMEKVLDKLYVTFDKWDSLDDLEELRKICESHNL